MDNQKADRSYLGRKILYALVIGMSSLVILISAVLILGVWLVERPLADASVSVFMLVENTASRASQVTGGVDQSMARVQEITQGFSDASAQLSQNVGDRGLIMTLLPQEREQKLVEAANSAQETFKDIRDTISSILDIYRSVNSLPFVTLPKPSQEQMQKLDDSITQIHQLAEGLSVGISDFRSGVASEVDKITGAADRLTNDIGQARTGLEELQGDLEALQSFAQRMQKLIPTILLISALIITLVFAYIIYTQVEVIRLFVSRWRLLGQEQPPLADKSHSKEILDPVSESQED